MRDKERRVQQAGERAWDQACGVAGIGDAGILSLFSRFVNGVGGVGRSVGRNRHPVI
jgi:hypothetical protein